MSGLLICHTCSYDRQYTRSDLISRILIQHGVLLLSKPCRTLLVPRPRHLLRIGNKCPGPQDFPRVIVIVNELYRLLLVRMSAYSMIAQHRLSFAPHAARQESLHLPILAEDLLVSMRPHYYVSARDSELKVSMIRVTWCWLSCIIAGIMPLELCASPFVPCEIFGSTACVYRIQLVLIQNVGRRPTKHDHSQHGHYCAANEA